MNDKSRSFLLLALVIIGSGMLLTAATLLLQPRIEQQRRAQAELIYFDLLSLREGDAEFATHNIVDGENLGLAAPIKIYLARRNGVVIGIVVPVVTRGYNGPIDLLVGLNRDGAITHVRVVSQRESRGIGDAIDISRSQWIENFAGQSDADIERVKLNNEGGTIDQITGATITSRAVARAVREALLYFNGHRDTLLESTP
jgi:electron transport complex protein RnfG